MWVFQGIDFFGWSLWTHVKSVKIRGTKTSAPQSLSAAQRSNALDLGETKTTTDLPRYTLGLPGPPHPVSVSYKWRFIGIPYSSSFLHIHNLDSRWKSRFSWIFYKSTNLSNPKRLKFESVMIFSGTFPLKNQGQLRNQGTRSCCGHWI